MSINNPKDPEMQKAYRFIALVAVAIGVTVAAVVIVQSRTAMSDARSFDDEMTDVYEPPYLRSRDTNP